MAVKLPDGLKPLADCVVQVVIGAIGFAIILGIAVALGFVINGIEALGLKPAWFIDIAHGFELGLFTVDLLLFSLFVLVKAVKLARSMLSDLRQG